MLLHNQEKNLFQVYTIIEATVSHLLVLQKHISSKQELKDYTLCLANTWNDFTINNMKKTRLKGSVKSFSVDFNPIDINDFLDILQYLIKNVI